MQAKVINNKIIVITGATSLIGHFFLKKIKTIDYVVLPFSRNHSVQKEQRWHQFDGDSFNSASPVLQTADILIHLGPLRTLSPLITSFAALGGKRVIAFSSTSRFSKLNSGNDSEKQLAQALINAEDTVAEECKKAGIEWTVFRPTLIYGAGLDKNVSSITRFIKRFDFFPLVGKASGLRQPVHAEDLAAACVAVIENKTTYGKAYDLVGAETLSYKMMVERIFLALEKKARYISFPLSIFRMAMKLAALIPAYSHVTPDMANRMNEDLCFDSEDAIRDFNYTNRKFTPAPEDLDKKLAGL